MPLEQHKLPHQNTFFFLNMRNEQFYSKSKRDEILHENECELEFLLRVFFMFRFMHERYNSPLYPMEGRRCEQAQHWKSIFLSFVDVLKLFYLFLLSFFYKHFVRDSFIFAIYWEVNTVNYPTIIFDSTKYFNC